MNYRFPYPVDMNTPRVPWTNGTGFASFADQNRHQWNLQQEQLQRRMNLEATMRAMSTSGTVKDVGLNNVDNDRAMMMMLMNSQGNMMSQNNQQMLAQNQQMMSRNQQMMFQNQQLLGQSYQQMMFQNSQQMMGQNNQQMMFNQYNRMPGSFQNNLSDSQILNNSFTQGIRPLMSLMIPQGPIQLQNFNQSNKNQQNVQNMEQGCDRNSKQFKNRPTPNSSRMPSSNPDLSYDLSRKQATNCLSGGYSPKSKWRDTERDNDSKHKNSSNASYSEELKVDSVVTRKRQVTRSRSCGSGNKDWRNTREETVTVQTKETIVRRTPVHTVFEYNHSRPSRDFPTSLDAECHYSSETDVLTDPEMETRLADKKDMECDLDSAARSTSGLRNETEHQPPVNNEIETLSSRDRRQGYKRMSQEGESLDGLTTERTDKRALPPEWSEQAVTGYCINESVLKEPEQIALYGNEDNQTAASSGLHRKRDTGKAKSVGIINGKYVFDQDEYELERSKQAGGATVVKQRNEKEIAKALLLRNEAWNNILKNTINKSFEDSSTESASEALMSDTCSQDFEVKNSRLRSILKKPISAHHEERDIKHIAKSFRHSDESGNKILKNNVNKCIEDSSTESASEEVMSDTCTHDLEVRKTRLMSILKKPITPHCREDGYSPAHTSDETDYQLSPLWMTSASSRSTSLRSAVKRSNGESEKQGRKQIKNVRPSVESNFLDPLDSRTEEQKRSKIRTGGNSVYKTLLEMDKRGSRGKSGRQIEHCTITSPETSVSSKMKMKGSVKKYTDKQNFQDTNGKIQGSGNPKDELHIPGMEHYVLSPPSNPPSRPVSPCSREKETTLKILSPDMNSLKSFNKPISKKNNQSIANPSSCPKFWSADYLNFVKKGNLRESTIQKESEEKRSKTMLPRSLSMKPTPKWSKIEKSAKRKPVLSENIKTCPKLGLQVYSKVNHGTISSIGSVNAAPKVNVVEDNSPAQTSAISLSSNEQVKDSASRPKTLMSPSTFYGHETDALAKTVRTGVQGKNLPAKIISSSSVDQAANQKQNKEPSKSSAGLGNKKLTITLIRGKKYFSEHASQENRRSIMSPVSRRTNVRTCILAGRKPAAQTASAQKPSSSSYRGRKTRSLDSSPLDAKLMKDVRVRVEDLNLSKLTQARVPRICLGDRFAAQQKSMGSISPSKVKAKISDDKNKENHLLPEDYSKGKKDCLNEQQESLHASSQNGDECLKNLEEVDLENKSFFKTKETEVSAKPKRGRPLGRKKKNAAKTKESLSSRFSGNEFESTNKPQKKYGRPLGSKNKSFIHSTTLLTRTRSRSLRSCSQSSKQTVEMTVREETRSYTITKDQVPEHQISLPPKSNFEKPKVAPIKITVPKTTETDAKRMVTPLKISISGLRNSKKEKSEASSSGSVPTLKMILLRRGLITGSAQSGGEKQMVTPLKISGSSVTKLTVEPLRLSLKPPKWIDTSSENADCDSTTESETETGTRALNDCETRGKVSETTISTKREKASKNIDIETEVKTFGQTSLTKNFSKIHYLETTIKVSESMDLDGNEEDLSRETGERAVETCDNESPSKTLVHSDEKMSNKTETPMLSLSRTMTPDSPETDTTAPEEAQDENSGVTKELKKVQSSEDSPRGPSSSGEEDRNIEELCDDVEISSQLCRDQKGKDLTNSSKEFQSDQTEKQYSSNDNLNRDSSSLECLNSQKRKSSNDSSNIDEMEDDVLKKDKPSDAEENVNEVLKESCVPEKSTLDLGGYSSDNAEQEFEFEYDSGLDVSSFNRSEDSVERNIFDALISAAEKDDDLVQKNMNRHLRSKSDSAVTRKSRTSPRKRKSCDEVESSGLQKKLSKEKKRDMSAKERQRFENFQTNLRKMSKHINSYAPKSKLFMNNEKKKSRRISETSDTSPLKQSASESRDNVSKNKEQIGNMLFGKNKTNSQTSIKALKRTQSTKVKRTHTDSESSDATPRTRKGSESEDSRRLRGSTKGNNSDSTVTRLARGDDSSTTKQARYTSQRKDTVALSTRGENSSTKSSKQARNTLQRRDSTDSSTKGNNSSVPRGDNSDSSTKTSSTRVKNSVTTFSKHARNTSQRRESTDSSTKGNNSDSDAGPRRSRITFNMIKGDELSGSNLRRRMCLYCRTFSTRLNHIMKEHIKLVHPHKCVICKMAFKDERETRAHRLTRHVQEVHHCLMCRKVFTTPFHYKKHVRSKVHLQLLQVQKDTLEAICRVFSQAETEDSFSETLKKIQDQEAQLWNVGHGSKGRKALPAPGDGPPSCVQVPNLSHLKHFYYDNPDLESVVSQIKGFVNSQNLGLRTRQRQQLQDQQDEHFFFALPNVEDTESWTVTSESETEFSTRVTTVGNPDILETSLSEVLGKVLSENSAQTPSGCLSEASYASFTSNRSQSSTEPLIIDTATDSSYFSDVDVQSGQFLSLLSDDALSFEDDSSVLLDSPGHGLHEFLKPLQVPQMSLESVSEESAPVNALEAGDVSELPKPLTLPSIEPSGESQLLVDCTLLEGAIPKGSFNENDFELDASQMHHQIVPFQSTRETQDKCSEPLNYQTADSADEIPQQTVGDLDNQEVALECVSQIGKDERILASSYKGSKHIETTEVLSVNDLIQSQTGYKGTEMAADMETDYEGGSVMEFLRSTNSGTLNEKDGASPILREEIVNKNVFGDPKSDMIKSKETVVDSTVLKQGKAMAADADTNHKDGSDEVCKSSNVDDRASDTRKEEDENIANKTVFEDREFDLETKEYEIMMDRESEDYEKAANKAEPVMDASVFERIELDRKTEIEETVNIALESGSKGNNPEAEKDETIVDNWKDREETVVNNTVSKEHETDTVNEREDPISDKTENDSSRSREVNVGSSTGPGKEEEVMGRTMSEDIEIQTDAERQDTVMDKTGSKEARNNEIQTEINKMIKDNADSKCPENNTNYTEVRKSDTSLSDQENSEKTEHNEMIVDRTVFEYHETNSNVKKETIMDVSMTEQETHTETKDEMDNAETTGIDHDTERVCVSEQKNEKDVDKGDTHTHLFEKTEKHQTETNIPSCDPVKVRGQEDTVEPNLGSVSNNLSDKVFESEQSGQFKALEKDVALTCSTTKEENGQESRAHEDTVEPKISSISEDISDRFCESEETEQFKAMEKDVTLTCSSTKADRGQESMIDECVPELSDKEMFQNKSLEDIVEPKMTSISKEVSDQLCESGFTEQFQIMVQEDIPTYTCIKSDERRRCVVEQTKPEQSGTEMVEDRAGTNTSSGIIREEILSDEIESNSDCMEHVSLLSGRLSEFGQKGEGICHNEELKCGDCKEMKDGNIAGCLSEMEAGLCGETQLRVDRDVEELVGEITVKCSLSCGDEGFNGSKSESDNISAIETNKDKSQSDTSYPTQELVSETAECDINREQLQNCEGSLSVVSDKDSDITIKETTLCDVKTNLTQHPVSETSLSYKSDEDNPNQGKDSKSGMVRTSLEGQSVKKTNRVFSVRDLVLCQPNLSDSESLEDFPDMRTKVTSFKDEVQDMLKELAENEHLSESCTEGRHS